MPSKEKNGKWRGRKMIDGQVKTKVFATQAEAIQSLVIEQNLEILAKLRLHVVDRIRNDDPRAFLYERSQADKYTAGETDMRPPEVTELDIDDDTLSADGVEDLGLDFETEA